MKYDYDIVAIGGGAAGLVVATGAAGLGARTALIEKNKLGGDCTWYGCVPSKVLLKSSQVMNMAGNLAKYGISIPDGTAFNTKGVMPHVRDIIKKISEHHPPEIFEKRGIKVIFGSPRFIDRKTIEINGKRLTSKRFVLCPGSHPLIPPIEGIEDVDYLTNENVFDLEEIPKSIGVLGGGPIGVEMAQAMARLGADVTIVEMMDNLLFREDKDIAAALSERLRQDGINIQSGKRAVKVERAGAKIAMTLEDKGNQRSVIEVERLLVAVGRAPNVDGLDLEKANIGYSAKGVKVDSTLRTSADNIYACGDVVGPYQFSHMAEYQAVIAVGNALMPFKRRVDYTSVPWCTFTEPEVAHLGLTEAEARSQYGDVKVYTSGYKENDRAVTDLEEDGFTKVICDKKGLILGAHIVGAKAGDLIHEFVLAKSSRLGIGRISSAIHIYPTLSQVVKRSSDQYYTEMMKTGWFKTLTKMMLKFLR